MLIVFDSPCWHLWLALTNSTVSTMGLLRVATAERLSYSQTLITIKSTAYNSDPNYNEVYKIHMKERDIGEEGKEGTTRTTNQNV